MPLYAEILKRRLKKGEKYNIFLDDTRHPYNVDWMEMPADLPLKIIRNYKEFVGMIQACGLPEFISFDFDLHESHYEYGARSGYQICDYEDGPYKTGLGCAKWLVEYCLDNKLPLPKWQTHSMNPCGCANINGLLSEFKKFQENEAKKS